MTIAIKEIHKQNPEKAQVLQCHALSPQMSGIMKKLCNVWMSKSFLESLQRCEQAVERINRQRNTEETVAQRDFDAVRSNIFKFPQSKFSNNCKAMNKK